MSLTDKLVDLDEAIWKQFEKVTQKAHQELGWNKYDLAYLTNKCDLITGLGAGAYATIGSWQFNSSFGMGMGVIMAISSSVWYGKNKKRLNEKEKQEIGNLSNGLVYAPRFDWFRQS